MPFDSTVSIGGQSLLDGLWRILQPALQSLTNPLPITVPGMTNAWVRIRNITPSLVSGSPVRLLLLIEVEARGDILLTGSVKAGTVSLALPNANLTIPPTGMTTPRGHLQLPRDVMEVPDMRGTLPSPVTGSLTLSPVNASGERLGITLPMGGTFELPTIRGVLNFVDGTLGNVGLPLPSVVPLAFNLTPENPALVPTLVELTVHNPIDRNSAFGLLLELGTPTVDPIFAFPDSTILINAIQDGLHRLLTQLGVRFPTPIPGSDRPFADFGPTLAEITTTATTVAAAAQGAIQTVVKDLLASLTGRTGRLVFSSPAAGSPCDIALLPTAAQARIVLAASAPVLQVGFYRPAPGPSVAPFVFPDFTSLPAADVHVKIFNDFLRDLLCCLVEKLPNFTFHGPVTLESTPDKACGRWSGVTLELWPLVLTGTLSLCIVGPAGRPKTVELEGDFAQETNLGRIGVKFTIQLGLHLNDVASVTGLKLATVTPTIDVDFSLAALVVVALAIAVAGAAGLSGAGFLALLLPTILFFLVVVPMLLINFVRAQLRAVVDTLLSRAHGLTSPVAVPPGIFEAFGRFVPLSMEIDDLVATGVLATPTSPWALMPIGTSTSTPPEHTDPKGGNRPPLTHLTATESEGPA